MPEPLDEVVEESWIEFLNRFDVEIYPLFEGRGVSKADAMIIWSLARLESEIEDIKQSLSI